MDRVIFVKIKNASIIINNEKYIIRFYKYEGYYIPLICVDNQYIRLTIRIFKGELYAMISNCINHNIDYVKNISLVEYFVKYVRKDLIDLIRCEDLQQLRKSIVLTLHVREINNFTLSLCDKYQETTAYLKK